MSTVARTEARLRQHMGRCGVVNIPLSCVLGYEHRSDASVSGGIMKTIRVWLNGGGTLSLSGRYEIRKGARFLYIDKFVGGHESHVIALHNIKQVEVGSSEKKQCPCATCHKRGI